MIDVFSALLKNNGKLDDLLDAEFAYASPYAPAVDPLFSLGCAAKNAMLEGFQPVSPMTSLDNAVIIDVRQDYEIKARPVHNEEVRCISLGEIKERWEEIPKDSPLLLVCQKGLCSS